MKKNTTHNPNQYLSTLGERIRSERKKKSLTQKTCAQLCGVSAPTQSLYENGERAPNAEYLFQLYENGFDTQFILTGEKCSEEKNIVPIDQVIKDALTVLHRPDFQPNRESEVEKRADLTNYLFVLIKSTQEGKLDKSSVEGILRLVG